MHANQSTPDTLGLSSGPVALVLHNLDLVLLALALAPALALGAPSLGLLVGVGAWALQRVLQHANHRLVSRATRVQPRFGLNLVEAFGRIWLLAGAIVLAGVVGGRAAGLTAALVIFFAYSVAFALRLIQGRPGGLPQ